jgi:hypothetical protein
LPNIRYGPSKKVERFHVKAYKNDSGTISWRVTGYWPDGKRERKNFFHKADAYEHRTKISAEAEGATFGYQLQRTTLSHEQLADAESATSLAAGQPLAEIVAHYQKLTSTIQEQTGLSLDGAVHFLAQHYKPELEDVLIGAAISNFLIRKEGYSKKTHAYYSTSLKLLKRLNPNTFDHQISLKTLEPLLAKYKNNNTQRTYRRALSTFFNWFIRHHYTLENPCTRLDQLPADNTQVAILSLSEVKRLLRAAMLYHDGVMASALALALFAGLRPSENRGLGIEEHQGRLHRCYRR